MPVKTIRVVIAGGTGLVGRIIIDGLLRCATADFRITVLTRHTSIEPAPTSISPPPLPPLRSTIQVIQVDYTNPLNLVAALRNQDIVISAVHNSQAEHIDHALLDAAIAAGIPRFFPCDYGCNKEHPFARKTAARVFEGRLRFQARLEEAGKAGKIQWTVIIPGQFLDDDEAMEWLGFDIRKREATLYDGGRNQATGCTIGFLGDVFALVASMDGEEVRNRRILVAEVSYSGLKLMELFEQVTGEKWRVVENVSSAESLRRSREAEAKGDLQKSFLAHVIRMNYDGSGVTNLVSGLNWGAGKLQRKSLSQIVEATVAAKIRGSVAVTS